MNYTNLVAVLLIISFGLSAAQLELEAQWIRAGKPLASEKISMFVALKQNNVDILEV